MSDIDQTLETPDEDKEHRLRVAGRYTCSITQTAYTIAELTDGKADVVSVAESFVDRMRRLDKGPVESEMILKTNALTLDALFHKMVRVGYNASSVETMQATMNLAMRAQNQLRKTLLALEQVKNPVQKTFVAQQNISQVQQVNNGLIPEAEPAIILKGENELISGATHETLDTRRKTETIRIDTRMDTLAKVERT